MFQKKTKCIPLDIFWLNLDISVPGGRLTQLLSLHRVGAGCFSGEGRLYVPRLGILRGKKHPRPSVGGGNCYALKNKRRSRGHWDVLVGKVTTLQT